MNTVSFFPGGAEALWVSPSGGGGRGRGAEMQELNIEEGIGAASWGQTLPVVKDSQSHSCPAALRPRRERRGPACPGWENDSIFVWEIQNAASINPITEDGVVL